MHSKMHLVRVRSLDMIGIRNAESLPCWTRIRQRDMAVGQEHWLHISWEMSLLTTSGEYLGATVSTFSDATVGASAPTPSSPRRRLISLDCIWSLPRTPSYSVWTNSQ